MRREGGKNGRRDWSIMREYACSIHQQRSNPVHRLVTEVLEAYLEVCVEVIVISKIISPSSSSFSACSQIHSVGEYSRQLCFSGLYFRGEEDALLSVP